MSQSQASLARLNIVLHQPEIPQNAGNIARTAVALNARLWLVRPLGFRLDDKHMRRSGLDYWSHLQMEILDDWQQFVTRVQPERCWFFTKSATTLYTSVEYLPGDFLVFGSETRGLPRSLLDEQLPHCVRIPISDYVRSLNLSNAVAIAGYEALRQFGGE